MLHIKHTSTCSRDFKKFKTGMQIDKVFCRKFWIMHASQFYIHGRKWCNNVATAIPHPTNKVDIGQQQSIKYSLACWLRFICHWYNNDCISWFLHCIHLLQNTIWKRWVLAVSTAAIFLCWARWYTKYCAGWQYSLVKLFWICLKCMVLTYSLIKIDL